MGGLVPSLESTLTLLAEVAVWLIMFLPLKIVYMKVYDRNILSDHCLISFGLSMVLQVREENSSNEENTFPLEYRYEYSIWSTERSEFYTRELNSGIFITNFNQLSDHLSNASDESAIDEQ